MGQTAEHKQEILEQTIATMRNQKIRITPQREGMLKYLIETESHPTADDIYQELAPRFEGMSLATVYNNLNLFTKINIVRELNYGDDSSHYDFANQKHYHVICDNCGKIVDLYYPVLNEVERFAEQLTDFEVHNHHLEIYGLCAECKKIKID